MLYDALGRRQTKELIDTNRRKRVVTVTIVYKPLRCGLLSVISWGTYILCLIWLLASRGRCLQQREELVSFSNMHSSILRLFYSASLLVGLRACAVYIDPTRVQLVGTTVGITRLDTQGSCHNMNVTTIELLVQYQHRHHPAGCPVPRASSSTAVVSRACRTPASRPPGACCHSLIIDTTADTYSYE